MSQLTNLELTVLGIVWKKAPITAYRVRKEFITSPSTHFSGSAGSIYPLMERLTEQGLLESKSGKRGKRSHLSYGITDKGKAVLEEWLDPPLPEKSAAITFYPIRTRMYFLGLLPPERRIAFVDDALSMLSEEIREVKAFCDEYREQGEQYSELAMESGLYFLQSQVRWLKKVRERLTDPGLSR